MRIEIRRFTHEDRDAVFALYGAVFGREALARFRSRWDWQFFRNPSAELCPSRMWVADRRGEVVGYLAAFPQRMKLLGTECVVYHDCDLIVAASVRRRGLGRRLVEAYDRMPNALSNCLTYAPANGRIRTRVGYRPTHAVPHYFRPYDPGSIARFAAASGRLTGALDTTPTRWILGAAGSSLSPIISLINSIRCPRSSDGYATEVVRQATEEFDELWNRLSGSFPLLTVRDRRFVQWRFLDDPVFQNTLIAARDRAGGLVGYLAMRAPTNGGTRHAKILDVFCPPDSPRVVEALLYDSLSRLEEQDVGLVSCLGLDPRIRRTVRRYLYVAPARLDRPAWLLWKGADHMREAVYDADNWHISRADSDIGFAP